MGQFGYNKKAFADSVLKANGHLDWVKRLYEPNAPSIQVPGEKYRSTHLMSDDGNGYVYPSIIRLPNGKLQKLTEDQAYDYAKKTNTGIQLPKQQGSWFAANGYKIGTGVNNDISPNGQPTNNPNVTINDKGELNYGAPMHSPLSNEQKTHWNLFQDYLKRVGYAGSPKLDDRTMTLGQGLLNKFNQANPGSQIRYEDVPRIQAELQAYRQQLVDQWKKNPAVTDAKTEAEILPGLSPVDGWLGSKTSSFKFPGATLTNSDGTVQNFGVDTKAYDNTIAKMK